MAKNHTLKKEPSLVTGPGREQKKGARKKKGVWQKGTQKKNEKKEKDTKKRGPRAKTTQWGGWAPFGGDCQNG